MQGKRVKAPLSRSLSMASCGEVSSMMNLRRNHFTVPEEFVDCVFVNVFANKKKAKRPDKGTFSNEVTSALGFSATTYRKYVASMETDVDQVRNMQQVASTLQHSVSTHQRHYMKRVNPEWREQYLADKSDIGSSSDDSDVESPRATKMSKHI